MQERPLRASDPSMVIEMAPENHFDVPGFPMQSARSEDAIARDQSADKQTDIEPSIELTQIAPETDNEERELFGAMAEIKASVVNELTARGALQGTYNENLRVIDDALGANQAFCALREKVTQRYTEFVGHLSRKTINKVARYGPGSISDKYAEGFQIGYLGLIKAANRFDMNRTHGEDGRHLSFMTYAAEYIYGDVAKYYRDRSGISRPAYETMPAIAAAETELRNRGIHNPTAEETADITGIPAKRIEEVLNIVRSAGTVSLDALSEPDEGEGNIPIFELSTESDEAAVDDRMVLNEALATLPEREHFVFSRILSGYKQTEVAKEMGVSQMHVSRLWIRTRTKLLECLESPDHSIDR